MHVKRSLVLMCVLAGGVSAWLVIGKGTKSFPSRSEVVAGEDHVDVDSGSGTQNPESTESRGASRSERLPEPLNFPPKSPSSANAQAKTDLDSFLTDYIFASVSQDLTFQEAKKRLVSAGVSPTETNSGNKDTGERVLLSFQEAISLGLSIFSVTYQKGDKEAFDRLLYGKSPDPSSWNEEFNRMKSQLDETFSPYSISKKESDLFVLWRLKDEKIVWINGDHQGYGQKMILVGYEYEIH